MSIMAVSLLASLVSSAQGNEVQNHPYTDLKPFHFGVLVGFQMQDIELMNVGPQVIAGDDGTTATRIITCDQDRWDPGFAVGVLADFRLSDNFSFRVVPALYFGTRHLTFKDVSDGVEQANEYLEQKQDLKSVYISAACNLLFAAPRLNNTRPYIMAGLNPMLNLSGKDSDIIKLKSYDVFFEVGLGCSFYLPFFRLRPELKFSYGLINSLDTGHPDRIKDDNMRAYAGSVSKGHSKMLTLSFYFE